MNIGRAASFFDRSSVRTMSMFDDQHVPHTANAPPAAVLRVWARCVCVAAVCLMPHVARAQDTVVLGPTPGGKARVKLVGEVLEYTGRGLVLKVSGGPEQRIPAERVLQIDTRWTPEQVAGEELLAQRQFAAADEKFVSAGRAETRRWVRHKLLAQRVVCLREQGRLDQAGEYFLILLKDDPATPYFAVVPLAWLPGSPTAGAEQRALGWLNEPDAPLANLLGASHLLLSNKRDLALARLERLAADKDARIAGLAEAQIWRGTFVEAPPAKVAAWAERIERVPEPLRAGPYLVLGRALVYHREFESGALALLRLPILFPEQHALAVEARNLAAGALDQAGQKEEAERLRRSAGGA